MRRRRPARGIEWLPQHERCHTAYPPFLKSSLEELFAATESTFAKSNDLLTLGLTTFELIADWKDWISRRVETVTILDPDTVRRQVSVDFTVPNVPALLDREYRPLRFLPLAMLRKSRLTHFDLRDETGRALPLMTRRASGMLAAATLVEGARALQGEFDFEPSSLDNLARDLWKIATQPDEEARETWCLLALTRENDTSVEQQLRHRLTSSWRFLSLANDLARNFLVIAPLTLDDSDRRIVKFAYTEQSRLAATSLKRPRLPSLSRSRNSVGPRHLLTIKASIELKQGPPEPMEELQFELLRPEAPNGATRWKLSGGSWLNQVDTGVHELVVDVPPGLMLTGRLDQSTIRVEADTDVDLVFRRVPYALDHSSAKLSLWRKVRRQVGWDAKTVEIIVPAVAQAWSYHFEYVVAAGLQATCAKLEVLPTTRAYGEFRQSAEGLEEDTEGLPPNNHPRTAHRVHLHQRDVPQEYAALAVIELRARSSTILRGASWVAILSLAMIALLRYRWYTLGTGAVGTETALLLAIPAGLSAYVARSQRDTFTSMVLVGLRGLALASALWCLAAATLIATSRATRIDVHGKVHVGGAWGLTDPALMCVLALNTISLLLLLAAWYRSTFPRESNTKAQKQNRNTQNRNTGAPSADALLPALFEQLDEDDAPAPIETADKC